MRRRLAIAVLASATLLPPHRAQTPTEATQPPALVFEKEIALGKSLAAEVERHEKICRFKSAALQSYSVIVFQRAPRVVVAGGDSGTGLSSGAGYRTVLSTITTKKTRHRSQPPCQQTRQPSMRFPKAAGWRSRKNLV